jgi:cytochrome P450
MQNYLKQRAQEYRQQPADNIFSDVANSSVDGQPLTDDEIVSVISQVLVAGNETTTNTISMGLHLMIKEGLESELRADPSKIPNFVEEALRLTTSLQGLFRRANEATEIAGVRIPKDGILMLRWAAGNRDERKFDNPDKVDLTRSRGAAHLTFGFGIHYCPGNVLARTELNAAFRLLLARMKNFRIAKGEGAEQWIVHIFARGMSRLEVEFDHA